jgi:hypothetical protein
MGKVEEKVKAYLEKIKKEDKKINAFLSLNPNVLAEARAVDKKKKKGRLYVRGWSVIALLRRLRDGRRVLMLEWLKR